ncbi:MAG: exodeoxyribonuclease VII small subunit [Cellvibrionales bacterium]|nr:exodeoxyribonuclease VII small subunit [Cellvibrionales bacterium]
MPLRVLVKLKKAICLSEFAVSKAKSPTLKTQMDELAAVIEKLEDPEVSLEDSLVLYERGMALVGAATKALEAAGSGSPAMSSQDSRVNRERSCFPGFERT